MICNCCFTANWDQIFEFCKPDKYEEYCKIDEVNRAWFKCVNCGHYQSESNYDLSRLMKVYQGYRSEPFRGYPIKEKFKTVMALPNHKRENHSRVNWVNLNVDFKKSLTVLDVGSGFGVFPHELREMGFDVKCTEINKDSIEFLTKELGFECFDGTPGEDLHRKFGLVTMVHVLEHLKFPTLFLDNYKKFLGFDGQIFIEVPDSIEFRYLPKEHDEFNSCHFHFFTIPSLTTIVERSGFTVKKVERVHHPARGLSRIRLLGRRN